MTGQYIDASLIIVLAAAFGILAHIFRQPTLIAYLLTGVLVSAFGILRLPETSVLTVMSSFGITFLLFLIGLEMRVTELKYIGKTIIITTIGHLLVSVFIGYGVSQLFGFSALHSFYIAVALAFSSTIIAIKLLSEKRDIQSLYGRITIGFLLIQDIVAIMMLIIMSGFHYTQHIDILSLILICVKAIGLFALTIWLSRHIIPRWIEKIAHNNELLFIGSIAWAFIVAVVVSSPFIGFSVEIGGFLAGLALANSAEKFQIVSRIKPLRDFFIVIFFIVLGSKLIISQIADIIIPAIVLILFVVVLQPLIIMGILALLGYRKRTSFMSGMMIGQVSEFSLIIMSLSVQIGHTNQRVASLVTLVTVVSIIISSYIIIHSDKVFYFLRPLLSFFEKKSIKEFKLPPAHPANHIILIGAHRMGQYILKSLPAKSLTIVEFDPTIAQQLQRKGMRVVFGDIMDPEIRDHIHFDHAALIISTIPHDEENLSILKHIQSLPKTKRPAIILNAQHAWEVKQYYQKGADYVLFPHFISAEHITSLLKKGLFRTQAAHNLKTHDIALLDV